jgi:hypothetical protein
LYRGSDTCRTLQKGVEGLVKLFEEEQRGKRASGRVGRGVRLFPYPPTSFEVEQANLPRDLDPRTGDGLLI